MYYQLCWIRFWLYILKASSASGLFITLRQVQGDKDSALLKELCQAELAEALLDIEITQKE